MLVLTRKQGEELVIDGNIHVRVVNCGKGRVQLGVQAPTDVPIRRGELDARWTPKQNDPSEEETSSKPR